MSGESRLCRNGTVQHDIKSLVIAESAEVLEPIEARLQQVGLRPDRMIGVSFLPVGPLPHDLVFLACSADPGELGALLEKLRPRAQLVSLVSPGTDLAAMVNLIADPRCNHALQDDGERGAERLRVTAGKLISGDIFGLEKYLPEAGPLSYIRIHDYKGRSEVIEQVVSYAEESRVRRTIRQTIAQVCEELLMNALYNAPVDAQGRAVFADVSARDRLTIDSPRPVSIRYGASEDWFGLAVRDRFGTLTKDTVFRYIHKCLHSQQQIDGKTIGAGLGLYLVASRSREYVVNVAPGIATEAIATFSKKGGATRSPGILSVFVHPGSPRDDGDGSE